jgi:peptidoglycan-N-acetylglucosamine deacetylase
VSRFRVALTFDAEHPDRPTRPGVTEAILGGLEHRGVRASFFLQGRWVEAYPTIAARIAAAGHLIGSHSHYHARMPLLSESGMRADLAAAERAIRRTCRRDPRPWFRSPFGAGADDVRLTRVLDEYGYRHVGWIVDGRDWRVGLSMPALLGELVAMIERHGDGALVLLHAWPASTGRALPKLLDALGGLGVELCTVDALVPS